MWKWKQMLIPKEYLYHKCLIYNGKTKIIKKKNKMLQNIQKSKKKKSKSLIISGKKKKKINGQFV